ncbi:heavy-metal-associated domain-containing protein [Promicromonospora sp. NPDC023805]|uniref:heavy-metal-associated domain-containing protein n=1 Tax=Promicromonospora sp. NPDC023805 TaxID=3154696 RepID=UPI003403DED9
MNAPQRLGAYGAGLAVLFVAAFAVAGAVVPQSAVGTWSAAAQGEKHEEPGAMEETMDTSGTAGATTSAHGLALEQDGLLLSPVSAPGEVGEAGTLSFLITAADGVAVTDFETAHDKKLHLIVVRADGSQFRHVHPTMSADGVWSIPWTWDEAGTYRVFTDFVPGSTGENLTLSRTVDVAGPFSPEPATEVTASDTVDGYTATLTGDLSANGSSVLTATVTKDGEPVTTLEPYFGAYGHLVALRGGDLAYLHVHPEGDEPAPGSTSGPDVEFMTEAPTPGRYLLYLDFQVGGKVRTAEFVLDAGAAPAAEEPAAEPTEEPAEEPAAGHGGSGHDH